MLTTEESISVVKMEFLEESLLTTILVLEGLAIAGPANVTICSLRSK